MSGLTSVCSRRAWRISSRPGAGGGARGGRCSRLEGGLATVSSTSRRCRRARSSPGAWRVPPAPAAVPVERFVGNGIRRALYAAPGFGRLGQRLSRPVPPSRGRVDRLAGAALLRELVLARRVVLAAAGFRGRFLRRAPGRGGCFLAAGAFAALACGLLACPFGGPLSSSRPAVSRWRGCAWPPGLQPPFVSWTTSASDALLLPVFFAM